MKVHNELKDSLNEKGLNRQGLMDGWRDLLI
jgi:hypothetical protein